MDPSKGIGKTVRRLRLAAVLACAAAILAAAGAGAGPPPAPPGAGWSLSAPAPADAGAAKASSVQAPNRPPSASSRDFPPGNATRGSAGTFRLILLDIGMAALCALVFGALVFSPAHAGPRGRAAAGRGEGPPRPSGGTGIPGN